VLYVIFFLYLDLFALRQYTGCGRYAGREIDALVVFFGDFDDNGNIGNESLRRLSLALELHKKHIGKNIIFVGGYRPSEKLNGSFLMADRAIKMGIKPSNIFYDMTSRDTLQNWQNAEKIITSKNFERVILISSPFHLIRIEHMIEMKDIRAYYATYEEENVLPPKSIYERFSDYNYNAVSIIAYLVLPAGLYQGIINKLRN
jgi:uncharacterized SAM-binding protein YcdF (DUF218 family)